MSEGDDLGTAWCLATAAEHIDRIEADEREQEFYRVVLKDETIQIAARPAAEEPRRYPTERSVDGLLLVLRDGYVRATGRRSTTRRRGSADGNGMWRLHATDPTLITTDEWRVGEFDADNLVLTGPSWQYIHIQVPDFMVVRWLLEQDIEGEPVSHNLADAMATLIRLPSAQRGGAKRSLRPNLRRTG